MMDVWPRPAAIVDFGIDNDAIYAAYQSAVRRDNVTANQLHAAVCSGPKLTALLRACSHVDPNITITTSYDMFEEEEVA
jgi:hypothetical protein